MLLADSDSIVFLAGADSLGVRPEAATARFWIASITKTFTAAAIVRLQQEGFLRTTQLIGEFVRDVPSDKGAITLYHLLTHTSGLANAYGALDESDRTVMLQRVLREPLAGPIGQSFAYADDNYSVLAAVVEIVSGVTFEEYVRQTFLDPAGMRDTGFWNETDGVYPLRFPMEYVQDRPNWTFKGAGGMSSTAVDLWRWTRALQDTTALNSLGRDLVWSPHVPLTTVAYSFGWSRGVREGSLQIRASGADDFGSNGMVGIFPEFEMTLVVLSHSMGPQEESLGIDFYRELAALIVEARR